MDETTGKTTIAPSVLHTIAKLTTLATPGVSRLSIREGLTNVPEDGVKVTLQGDAIEVEIFIVAGSEENVRLVAQEVQKRVTRAITEMVGMEVARIDVHVTDIDLEA
jgi:uncharacterized alkaline shock family protein YloU